MVCEISFACDKANIFLIGNIEPLLFGWVNLGEFLLFASRQQEGVCGSGLLLQTAPAGTKQLCS